MENVQEQKTRSLRADDTTYEKFKQLSSEEFGNQGQCLSALLNAWEIEKSKAILTNRALEIENFQDHLNKISAAFLSSLELNQDAEGRIREEFARQLDSKDNMIIELQARLDDLKRSNQLNEEMLKLTKQDNKEFTGKVAVLEKTIEKQNKDYEIALADKDSLNKALTDSCNERKAEIESLKLTIESTAEQLNNLKTIEAENKNLSAENNKLKNDIEKQIEAAALEKEKALLAADRSHQQEIKEINNQFNDKIDKFQEQQQTAEKLHQQELKELTSKANEEIKEYNNKVAKLQENQDATEKAHYKEISEMSEKYNNKIQSLLEKIERLQDVKEESKTKGAVEK